MRIMATSDLHGNHDFYPIAHILCKVSCLDERYEIAYEPTWVEV